MLGPKLTREQCAIQHYLNEMFSHLRSPLISYQQGGSANAGATKCQAAVFVLEPRRRLQQSVSAEFVPVMDVTGLKPDEAS